MAAAVGDREGGYGLIVNRKAASERNGNYTRCLSYTYYTRFAHHRGVRRFVYWSVYNSKDECIQMRSLSLLLVLLDRPWHHTDFTFDRLP